MRILFVGETREAVAPTGPGGLGRHTYELATDLRALGHDVTLLAPQGAVWDKVVYSAPAQDTFDVMLDYSHHHEYGRNVRNCLHLIGDRECQYTPHNAVVESEFMQRHYKTARLTPAGIVTDDIPDVQLPRDDTLLFLGANVGHKQPDFARQVAHRSGKQIRFVGPGFHQVSDYEKWLALASCLALIAPYTIDASPRTPLEAAACGTPTLCLNGDGTRQHVLDGVTGFVCLSMDGMIEAVGKLATLDRSKMRAWVEREHNNRMAAAKIERLLAQVMSGESW